MPPRAPQPVSQPAPTTAPTAAPAGLGGTARWALALAAPAVPLAVVILAHLRLAPELLRLALLVVVALVGVGLGTGPAILTALVATALGWYSPERAGWTVDPRLPADQITLGAYGLTALVVAATAGARRGTASAARWLRQELEAATAQDAMQRQTIERLTRETATLRADSASRAADLTDARATVDRLERSRKAILDSLPHDLRAPHVVPPTALQLFPPLLTAAPLGIAPPPVTAPAAAPATSSSDEPPPRAEWE